MPDAQLSPVRHAHVVEVGMLSTGSCHVWSIGADQTGPCWCCCCCLAVLQPVVCSGLAGPWAGGGGCLPLGCLSCVCNLLRALLLH